MAERLKHDKRLRFMLGDVRDRDRLHECLKGCQIAVHAAALKRVDAIAYNPGEVVYTNVLGTQHLTRAAITAGIQKVVTISSDKAVHPQNSYGASKNMAEHITVGANVYGYPVGTTFAVCRYGNVLGSRGSVVGVFRKLRETGQPLLITHQGMTRFWLRIQAACELVMTALQTMRGGEIYLPKLPRMQLMDLAEAVAPGHPWTEIGLRPGGEKIHERLLADEEASRTFDRGTHYVIAPNPHPWTAEEWSGTLVPADFRYESSTDGSLLTVQELRTMCEGI